MRCHGWADCCHTCRKLRNADGALQLLASFHGTEDSGPLAAQLLAKTTEILAQYARELDAASGQFRAGKVRGGLVLRAALLLL